MHFKVIYDLTCIFACSDTLSYKKCRFCGFALQCCGKAVRCLTMAEYLQYACAAYNLLRARDILIYMTARKGGVYNNHAGLCPEKGVRFE